MSTPRRAIDPPPRAEAQRGASGLRQWLETLRWIPPRQLAALVAQRVRSRVERPEAFATAAAPADPGVRWSAAAMPPVGDRFDAQALRAGRFTFVNETRETGWPPRWEDAAAPRLWQYNLHYFEFLAALDYDAGRALILDWIAQHGLAKGRVGWEPYPTSLRLLNWCAWLHVRHRERVAEDAALRAEAWPSIWRQVEWLTRHLETHLRANHLLENAAALAFVGACFGGPGEKWLATGLHWLDRELPEQLLDDGMHFERSPMYHARVVEVLTMLEATREPRLVSRVAPHLARARRALAALCHPDGEIALLNDAAFGIAPHPSHLAPDEPADGVFGLASAGYYGARAGDHYVVCDAAPIGPDYNPGHAHADLLSFELSLGGSRVLVDAGVHGYDGDPHRAFCRSTAAHNTVEIAGADQCEMWGTFRVGHRARPCDVSWQPLEDGFVLSAGHDGYERLAGRPRHMRVFRWFDDGVLLVRDRVAAERAVSVAARWHLHPDCEVASVAGSVARIRHPGGTVAVGFAGEGTLAVEPSLYCPEFGRAIESQALVYTARATRLDFVCCIAAGAQEIACDLATGARVDGRRYAFGTDAA